MCCIVVEGARDGGTCTIVALPVSGFKVAIPISRDIPRPSRRATMECPSGRDDAAVWGLVEVGRRRGVVAGADMGFFGIFTDRRNAG